MKAGDKVRVIVLKTVVGTKLDGPNSKPHAIIAGDDPTKPHEIAPVSLFKQVNYDQDSDIAVYELR